MELFQEMTSIIKSKKLYWLLSIIFWILLWFILSLIVGEELFLPSPWETILSLIKNIESGEFWLSILTSFKNIILSLLLSFSLSLVVALFANYFFFLESLLSPLVKTMRSVPVASIIILILLWVKSKNLPLVVSFLMTFPILYSSLLSGLKNTDSRLLEMAGNYSVSTIKRIRYIYLPSIFPSLKNGLRNAIGFAWKSSVASEVIALPENTIGSMLYEAKIYLMTDSLFSLTLAIVLLSFSLEKLSILLLDRLERRIVE